MREETPFNILDGFNFELLDDPEFQEDSVREEIILPILKGLGYSPNKPNQIIRSRKLTHPYVSIGSQRKEIYIIPDYLMEVSGKPAWILDAKSPKESIHKSVHVEQAYSYAIHSEVRVKHFALCNGRDFALYNIEQIDPIIIFPIRAVPLYWESLKKFLSPEYVLTSDPFRLSKDLGLHLKRLGFEKFERLIFPGVPITHIAQMDPNYFSTSGSVKVEDTSYVVTFDFGIEVLKQFGNILPKNAMDKLLYRNNESRTVVQFADKVYYINVECHISEKLEETEKEIFLPLWIDKIHG